MNQPAQNVETVLDRIHCLIATLSDRKLLLPITAVAEVMNTVTLPEYSNDDTPLYGWIRWRDQRIPLFSMENAMGAVRPEIKPENRMVILNAIGAVSELGFYAILLQGLPTPIQVGTESIRSEGGKTSRLMVLSEAMVGEEHVLLPDLMAVEAMVNGFKKR